MMMISRSVFSISLIASIPSPVLPITSNDRSCSRSCSKAIRLSSSASASKIFNVLIQFILLFHKLPLSFDSVVYLPRYINNLPYIH